MSDHQQQLSQQQQGTGFYAASGASFQSPAGAPFRFGGANTYYLYYQDAFMVEDVFARAAQRNMSVLRTWAFSDIGFPNGTEAVDSSNALGPNGVWFQALGADGSILYNETNFERLDFVVATAARFGIALILTLSNNWANFGGADQYVRWESLLNASYESPRHDDFFTRPWQMSTYIAYVQHVANRVNSITGVAYKDDPTIFAWELLNEPRCQGSGVYPSSNNCTLNYAVYDQQPVAFKIPPWVAAVSTALKAVDAHHMVAVGDEGFFCQSYQAAPYAEGDCYYGTDFAAMTALPSIDFGSLHLYPSAWGHDATWGAAWIQNHTQVAHALNKPVVLGEFGVPPEGQSGTYAEWTDLALSSGMNGDIFWMSCGRQDSGAPWYPSYDGFCVYCVNNASEPTPPSGDPNSCAVLAAHATAMAGAGGGMVEEGALAYH